MGDAKKKAAALTDWQNKLSSEEGIILAVSKAAYDKIIIALGMTEACYRISFFLASYLSQEHSIRVEPIVGYVNDGESDLMASHAWIEFNGKKIDLGLTMTSHPEVQPPGPLLILDRQLKAGKAIYTYHRKRNQAALREVENLLKEPTYRDLVLRKEAEHKQMEEVAGNPALIRGYLDAAPMAWDMRNSHGGFARCISQHSP